MIRLPSLPKLPSTSSSALTKSNKCCFFSVDLAANLIKVLPRSLRRDKSRNWCFTFAVFYLFVFALVLVHYDLFNPVQHECVFIVHMPNLIVQIKLLTIIPLKFEYLLYFYMILLSLLMLDFLNLCFFANFFFFFFFASSSSSSFA